MHLVGENQLCTLFIAFAEELLILEPSHLWAIYYDEKHPHRLLLELIVQLGAL